VKEDQEAVPSSRSKFLLILIKNVTSNMEAVLWKKSCFVPDSHPEARILVKVTQEGQFLKFLAVNLFKWVLYHLAKVVPDPTRVECILEYQVHMIGFKLQWRN